MHADHGQSKHAASASDALRLFSRALLTHSPLPFPLSNCLLSDPALAGASGCRRWSRAHQQERSSADRIEPRAHSSTVAGACLMSKQLQRVGRHAPF